MKRFFCIIFAFLILIPSSGWAFQNEPMGFNDLYLGKDFWAVIWDRKIEHSKADVNQLYGEYFVFLKDDEEQSYLGIPVLKGVPLVARFYNDKLAFLDISFWGESMLERLHSAMVKEYGEPNYYKNGIWYWFGNHVYVMLVANDIESGYVGKDAYCSVRIISKNAAIQLAKMNRK